MVKDAAVREFEDAVIVRNLVARSKEGKSFPSQDALDAYLKEHPKADKSKHKVEDADDRAADNIMKRVVKRHQKGPGALSDKDQKKHDDIMKRVVDKHMKGKKDDK